MEIIANFCNCNIDDNSNYVEICGTCKRSIHINNLKNYFDEIKIALTVDDRLIIINKIFEYLLTYIDFLLSEKNLCNIIKNKIEELLQDDRSESIKDILLKVKNKIENN
jgi:adenosine deaminase